MKQLLFTIILTLSFVCKGQINSHKDFDYNDIVELKGLFYLKSDTTLVTGRVIRYNKKKEARRYVFMTEGKPDNLGWIQFKDNHSEPQKSVLGEVLIGAAAVTGAVIAVSDNDANIPIRNQNNQNSVNGYINEQKDNTANAYRKMSERNDISEKLNSQKKGGVESSVKITNKVRIETEGNYLNEKRDGIWKTYYINKNLKSKGAYTEDKKEGIWLEYYENGVLEKEVNYSNGKKEGLMKVYQRENVLKARVNYKDGKEDGVAEYYDEQGQIELKVNYKNGKEDGALEHYKDGQLVKIEFWKEGVKIKN